MRGYDSGELVRKYLKTGNIVQFRSGEKVIVFDGYFYGNGIEWSFDDSGWDEHLLGCKVEEDIMIIKDCNGTVLWEREYDGSISLDMHEIFSALEEHYHIPKQNITLNLDLSNKTKLELKY